VLKVGNPLDETQYVATTSGGEDGPLFALPGNEAWKALLKEPGRRQDLPEDVFAPVPSPSPG
jgi:hypothetical protein